MRLSIRTLLALVAALAVALVAAPAAAGASTTVNLRVEGPATTIFEGSVTTDAKTIVMDGVSRTCDGTNGGVNQTPGPTMTTALDDGAAAGGFDWHGTWNNAFDDFFVDRIDLYDSSPIVVFWALYRNHTATLVGGCQEQVSAGDEVLFAYQTWLAPVPVLKLTGPSTAAAGVPFTVSVVDGPSGDPVAGAQVGASATGPDGTATLVYPLAGPQELKATRADSVRSNRLVVDVQ